MTNSTLNFPLALDLQINGSTKETLDAGGTIETWNYLGVAGGTQNALAFSSALTPSYLVGRRYRFKSGTSANNAATTLQLGALGTIAIQVNGQACVGGEIQPSTFYEVWLDTTSTCQLITSTQVHTPCFSAYQSSTQTISTIAKIQLGTKEFDTTSAFDEVTNYRFTPQMAGYYKIIGSVQAGSSSAQVQPSIYKNGAPYKSGNYNSAQAFQTATIEVIVFLNGSTDYIELYSTQSVSQALTNGAQNGTFLSGVLVRQGI